PLARRVEEMVVRLRQRIASFHDVFVKRFNELVGGRLLILSASRCRREIQLVLIDDQAHPGRHRGHQAGEPSKRHRFRMRLPVVAAGRHGFQRPSGATGFTVQLIEKQLRQFHRPLLTSNLRYPISSSTADTDAAGNSQTPPALRGFSTVFITSALFRYDNSTVGSALISKTRALRITWPST